MSKSETNFRNICAYALDNWGMEAQLNQLAKECAEFIAALNHFKRGKIHGGKLLEEIADISIMVKEMAIYYPMIANIEERKIKRLQRIINKEVKEKRNKENRNE